MAKPTFDLYAGVSGLELAEESFDLGDGVVLSRTYAHLMAPFVMAFKRPAEHDQPHPGPWKSLGGGFAFDIDAARLGRRLAVALSRRALDIAIDRMARS